MSGTTQDENGNDSSAPELTRLIDTACDRFEAAWQTGEAPQIEDYLAEVPESVRSELLRHLQALDQAYRDRGGEVAAGESTLNQPREAKAATRSERSDPASTSETVAHDPCQGVDEPTMPHGPPPAPSSISIDPDAPLIEDDFQILRQLGAGGMGEVFEGVQKSLRKRVALKVINREALDSPNRVRRFVAEARTLARLKHPHIVGVHGIGRMFDGRYFLVMDLLENGTTLHDLIKGGPVPVGRAAGLVAAVAEAIEHAHSRSVIHRDLKPSNVLLDAEGEPHVTDFGLAKVFDTTDPDHPPTTADQILGTPHYMSPEQADPARGPVTPRTDVYGLGGLLFALLTGRPPLEGDSIAQLLTQLVSLGPIRSPRELRPEVPPALEQICRKCLHKEAGQRYSSAREVAGALHAWLERPNGAKSEELSDKEERADAELGAWGTDRSLKDDRSGRQEDERGRLGSTVRRLWANRLIRALSVLLLLLLVLTTLSYDLIGFLFPREGPSSQPMEGKTRSQPPLGGSVRPDITALPAPTRSGSTSARIAFRVTPEIIGRFRAGTGSLAIVLDCSGSMLEPQNDPKFPQAKKALAEVLKLVPEGTTVSLWTFSQLPEGVTRPLENDPIVREPERTISQLRKPAPWDETQIAGLVKQLENLRPFLDSALVQAMWTAAEHDLRNARGLKTLLVLTDGADTRFAANREFNPHNLSIPKFFATSFKPLGIQVNMVFFTHTVAEAEFERAEASFTQALNRLDPPGAFVTAANLPQMIQRLGRGSQQRLTCQILKPDGTRVEEEQDVALPGEEEKWSRDLEPGLFKLRVPGHKSCEQQVELKPWERLVVGLVNRDDGEIGFDLPRLALRTDPAQPNEMPSGRLRLRTIRSRQPFFLFVVNPAPAPRFVIVEIVGDGDTVLASSGPNPLSVKGSSTVSVPSFGDPVRKLNEPLPEAPGALRLRLREAVFDRVLDEQRLPVAIAAPGEYLEVTRAQFTPAPTGGKNRLAVTLRPLSSMAGPPCKVELVLPADKNLFPRLREAPKGRFEGDLEPGKELTVYAEDLKLDPTAQEEGSFYLNIDGLARALWYRTRFARQGGPQLATEDRNPRVRFQPELVFQPGQPAKLRVRFAVDNPPPDAKLSFRLGQGGVDDISPWTVPAKRRHIGFDPRGGPAGALLFEAAVEDWAHDFDVRGIRGRRRLEAWLHGANGGDVLDVWGMDLTLDDLPPQDAALEVPAEIEKGTASMLVKASVMPPPSGIKEAAFLVGANADLDKAEAEGRMVLGQPLGEDRHAWQATLPVPKDAAGKMIITVRFKSGVGLTGFASAMVAVRDHPVPNHAGAPGAGP